LRGTGGWRLLTLHDELSVEGWLIKSRKSSNWIFDNKFKVEANEGRNYKRQVDGRIAREGLTTAAGYRPL